MLPQFIARPAVRAAQRFVGWFGFDLVDYRPPNRDIKDADCYRPMFSPWLTPEWKERLRASDPRSLVPLHAKYVLYCLALDATRRCSGEVAECGVYKGGSAKILAELVPDRPLHLFDTFEGMPATDPTRDLHQAGDFADTDLASVREYLSDHKNVNCVPGLVPDSLEVIKDRTFSFVHIDLDIYSAIKSACEFFYPRMQPGGVLLFDDYGYPSCPGARAAVDEFFAGKSEVPVAIATGQCSVQKSSDVVSITCVPSGPRAS
jgi:O-methyltransferase